MDAKIDYVQDETGKYTDILVNGTSVVKKHKSYLQAFKKAATTSFFHECISLQSRYGLPSGLNDLEMLVYCWVKEWERRYHRFAYDVDRVGAPIATFDNMRYFFMTLNNDAYTRLLD